MTGPEGFASALERLAATPAPPEIVRRSPIAAPKGWEPGVVYDPTGIRTVTTTAWEQNVQGDPSKWAEMVRELGLEVPEGWVVRLVEAKYDPVAWTRDSPEQDKAVTKPVWRYRFRVEPSIGQIPIDDLLKTIRRKRATAPKAIHGPSAFFIGIGDTQIGKMDGDGAEGTVQRVLDSIEAQVQRVKDLRKIGRPIGPIYAAWLGDCIEGFVSQGGSNAWRTPMPLTEQVRIIRRLMLTQIDALKDLTEDLVVPVLPGNHDQAVRLGGKGITTYNDSWATEAGMQVADAIALNSAAYGHVKIVVPSRDEKTLTLDMADTLVGLCHGDEFRLGKAHEWWAKQAHGQQPIGDATILVSAHYHHGMYSQPGRKTHFQVRAFESESTWWKHKTGEVSPTGALTLVLSEGRWSDMEHV